MGLEFTDTNQGKKQKLSPEKTPTRDVFLNNTKVSLDRCTVCKQYLHEIEIYIGHPVDAVEEYLALTNDSLLLFNGNDDENYENHVQPTYKLTQFNVYDQRNHVAPFDNGLVCDNKLLYASGYIKAIYDEDPSTENGIPARDIGPINEWYVAGFDGEQPIIGIKTQFGDYYLMQAAQQYEHFMLAVSQKVVLAKLVIEFLLDYIAKSPSYEDLLLAISCSDDNNLNEETLIRHAQFICDQVVNLDSTSDPDEKQLITTPCMEYLIEIAGVSINEDQNYFATSINLDLDQKRDDEREYNRLESLNQSAITALVKNVFDAHFNGRNREINGNSTESQLKYCSTCSYANTKNCKHNGNYFNTNNGSTIGNGHLKLNGQDRSNPNGCFKRSDNKAIEWFGECVEENDVKFYKAVKMDDIILFPGDYVLLEPTKSKSSSIALIQTMFSDDSIETHQLHVQIFEQGLNTILAECADPKELFLIDQCFNIPVYYVHKKVSVAQTLFDSNWKLRGNLETPIEEFSESDYYFSKRYIYEFGRFEDVKELNNLRDTNCSACRVSKNTTKFPKIIQDHILWNDEKYQIFSAVYLKPKSFKFEAKSRKRTNEFDTSNKILDEDLYPEYYRKLCDRFVSGFNVDDSEPFCVGIIKDILSTNGANIQVKVRKLYRPENTHKGKVLTQQHNLNVLYWSEEEFMVPFSQVEGKCYVAYGHIINAEEWSKAGPDRFYFYQTYNVDLKLFEEPSDYAQKFGRLPKSSSTSNPKNRPKSIAPKVFNHDIPPPYPQRAPLRCMDILGGCGGLSHGLRGACAAETYWAIERDKAAAKAFRRNFPDCQVYTNDMNTVLKRIIAYECDMKDLASGSGELKKKYPGKGDVELLVASPSCLDFFTMNYYKSSQYTLFKNSQIATCLSYCDFFRPNYFLIENEPEFVEFQNGMILKLTIRCLLAIGYQVSFGLVQAGNYGVPQNRNHFIILAAAPGYILPKFPEPSHVFNTKTHNLIVQIDGTKYTNGLRWTSSSPYRTITIRDALSDLPPIQNRYSSGSVLYNSLPLTHYQRQMRFEPAYNALVPRDPVHVYDHVCKEMSPLIEARMRHISITAGSDWRDLPNIVTQLADGTSTNELKYPYRSWIQKGDGQERNKEVCKCASDTSALCDPSDQQFNTLIPWCLSHTADGHSQWAGLYGRLPWAGHFPAAITNPEPMAKQGRVLHPDQHRVISVRESARSQGFPDSYEFCGKLVDKYRQVGKAFPPPLGGALGREILKAYSESCAKQTD